MTFHVEFEKKVLEDLVKLDKPIAQRILNKIRWVSQNFPFVVPERLSGTFKGRYKLRVGDYRVIYRLDSANRMLIIELIGHRKEIYKL